MKKLLLTIPAALAVLLLSACSSMEESMEYDQNSWKTMIPDTCVSYFDGCNNCRREPGSDIAACTRKACMEYAKPVCLDGENE